MSSPALNEVVLSIDGTYVTARVDLGSRHCYINRGILPIFRTAYTLDCPLDTPVRLLQPCYEIPSHIEMIAFVNIILQDWFLPFKFFVVEMDTPLILGLDFFRHYDLMADSNSGICVIRSPMTESMSPTSAI